MNRITFNNINVPKTRSEAGSTAPFGELQEGMAPVFSGKTALALLLDYFRHSKQLENKMAEVLVPPWMGSWVYMTMQHRCFPTRELNPRVRGIVLYHQWGFPQRIEKVLSFAKKNNLFVIEDCAHAFEGYYKGKRLGTFGDAALFSLAKFFPCVVGGAIYTKNTSIREFVQSHIHAVGALEKRLFTERHQADLHPKDNINALAEQYALYDVARGCVPEALAITRHAIAGGALAKRKAHVERLRKEFDPHNQFGLFEENVVPWIVPLFFEKERMVRVACALAEKGVESGVFHFDVNRTMLDPDYRECFALPCHDGITDKEMEDIIRTVHGTK